jgi:endonuclease/exonuclease/phosphatase family metal-dependent hydrolase
MSTFRIKIIQINIYKGRYLESLVDFLKEEDPDFITMQEVTIGGFNLYIDKGVNIFELLQDRLGMYGEYHGDLRLKGEMNSRFGNAVFCKSRIIGKHVLVLKKFRPVTNLELDGKSGEIREQIDRHLLDTVVNFHGRVLHILSWHGAWTAPPADTKETFRQSRLVYKYLMGIKGPFILGGDLNAVIGSKTVDMIGKVSNNLMLGTNVKMTTNVKVHKIAPLGFLIDYIFVSSDFKLKSISVPSITVSDHLPVVAEVEINF